MSCSDIFVLNSLCTDKKNKLKKKNLSGSHWWARRWTAYEKPEWHKTEFSKKCKQVTEILDIQLIQLFQNSLPNRWKFHLL